MFSKKYFITSLVLYGLLRIFSFFCQPGTSLNTLITLVILLATLYLFIKKDDRGWDIVAAEIILGGSGNFLQAFTVSLRTILLATSLCIWFFHQRKNLKSIFQQNKIVCYLLFAIYLVISTSSFIGYRHGHNLHSIIADAIPYLFFLYYFPLKELLQDTKISNFKFQISNFILAAIAGNFLFILFTFTSFSTHLFPLQDTYYHWFRDIANGKITELPFNFYRIVINEHLLLIPLLLKFVNDVIARSDEGTTKQSPSLQNSLNPGDRHVARTSLLAMTLLAVLLSINLTRIYLVALVVGLVFLFNKTNWKRWLLISSSILLLFFASFTTIHLAASRGQSLGWELFGLRLQSIVSPSIEDSSLSRMLLLPKIIEKIKLHPLLGNGLGDTVTVYSPVVKQQITTGQFDWGYLEIVDELGIIGLIIWLSPIVYLALSFRADRGFAIQHLGIPFHSFHFASLIALLTINLTSPTLFHVFGIAWTAYLLAETKV